MRTGDAPWLAARYESLKPKLLGERARADGLLASTDAQIKRGDIVDWPVGERDGFDFKPVNTVVNAFHLRALTLMAALARAVGKADEADGFDAQFRAKLAVFGEKLFDPATGLYRDGEGSAHASLHANLFPLAFGLVPPERRAKIAQFLKAKGMACSVYAAQYLLEGLFEAGEADAALALILAPGDRSWRHMVESGTTITWEAWDNKYKPNQDWNHAWGAAPANLLPRYVLGVWQTAKNSVRIAPNPSALKHAEGKLPTPLGPVTASWKNAGAFEMTFTLPPSMNAKVSLPLAGAGEVFADGQAVKAVRENGRALVEGEWTGTHRFEVR